MMAFFDYLVTMFLCSGILFLYYTLALRNRQHHQWNRFYLLTAVAISIAVPFLEFTITTESVSTNGIPLLNVVESTGNYFEEVSGTTEKSAQGIQWVYLAYFGAAASLLALFLRSIFKIWRTIQCYPAIRFNNSKLINTNLPGTPYSFLNHIFWNEEIDINSTTGKQIFEHELVHVKEKHSLDKIFMELVVIFFWVNPFFWLIKKEISEVHEFIADQKTLNKKGASSLAEMILHAAYPNHFNALVNPFFQTSIKRRLMMTTKNHIPRFGYVSRILALGIIALSVLAFTVRTRTFVPLEKTFTVVVDAGHGYVNGKHSGAASNGTYEDDINLAIVNSIVANNQNPNIKIVLTRNTNPSLSLEQRVAVAKENNANLFLSVHVAASEDASKNGFDIFVPSKQPSYQAQSELFGSALQQELSSLHSTATELKKRETGIWVVDKNVCPSVLVECGYITNSNDRNFITNSSNQQAIAKKVLAAIEKYAASQQ